MIYEFPTHISGDTFDGIRFTLVVNGSAVNLAGVTITTRVYPYNSTKFSSGITWTVANNGLTVVDEASGIFQINPVDITLGPGTYKHYTQFVFPSNVKKTYIEGTWEIRRV